MEYLEFLAILHRIKVTYIKFSQTKKRGTHSILNLNLTAIFGDWKKKVYVLTNASFWPRSHGSTTRSHTKNRSVAIIISIIRSSASPFRKVLLASETIGTWPRHDIVIGVNGEASISYHKIFVIWPLASFGTWTAMHCRQNLKVKKTSSKSFDSVEM